MADTAPFQSAHDLAERLYKLQSAQADRMLDMLTTQAVKAIGTLASYTDSSVGSALYTITATSATGSMQGSTSATIH
jgi:hypothetical protein